MSLQYLANGNIGAILQLIGASTLSILFIMFCVAMAHAEPKKKKKRYRTNRKKKTAFQNVSSL